MKFTEQELINRTEEALRNCLDKVPFLKIDEVIKEAALPDKSLDLFLRLTLSSGEQLVAVEVKYSGQPRLARIAVNWLQQLRQDNPSCYGVFAAPYISPASAEICTKSGIGYVDFSGNCRLCFGQVYIEYDGRYNMFLQKRNLRSLYSPRATRVLRVLLNETKRVWKVLELAGEASVSLGQVANVKKYLADREWTRQEANGFALSNPAALIAEWADYYTYRKNRIRELYSLRNVAYIESEVAKVCKSRGLDYALTGFSAAARIAPMVKYQRVFAYVKDDNTIQQLLQQLDLKEVPTGANVMFFIPYDGGVFYGSQEVDGIRIVSPVQTYLDLVSYKGRGEEAASEILEKVLKPAW